MSKIQPELQAHMASDPETAIDVLITLKSGSNPAFLDLPAFKVLMDNTLVSHLDARKIAAISKSNEVLGIEMDSRMDAI